MKSRSLLTVAIIFNLTVSLSAFSQVQTARYNSINGNCGGYYEYLPQGYSSNTWQSYPLIVAVHGIGELGNGTTDLGNLLNCWTAIPRRIANGGFPATVSVGGQSFSFIVISPQFKNWPSGADVNAVVDYAVQHYRVDQSRIYVTGLSMGGGAVWDFAGNFATKAAAVVPVCGAASADPTRAQAIANAKLPIWATHNQDDPTVSVSNTTGWVSMINQYGGNIISTIFQASGHDAWSKTYDPAFTQNGMNVYQWMLSHQKSGSGSGSPAPNQAPTVSAGSNQTITLPTNSASLSGTASDPDGSIKAWEWKQASGPSQANIASANSANTDVKDLVEGKYIFTLTVTDDKGATAKSDVTLTVSAAPNQAPTVSAGNNQTITLPTNSASLSGTASDADGSIITWEWKQSSGPSQANIASANSASTDVKDLVEGKYIFTLTVTDDKGTTAKSDVTLTVNAAPNQTPTVSAGNNQNITLPTNSVTLSGTASDADGTIRFWEWKQASGPSQASIASLYSAKTDVSDLFEGTYTFTLKVTDDKGATATSDVAVIVNAAPNQAPTVSAGTDQAITLPNNSATLSGTASDKDGGIATYNWTQVTGPAQANFSDASAASTKASQLIQGSYTFRLTVVDNKGASAWSEVKVTVNPAPNKAPTVSAGSNQSITLPTNSTTLSGTASDADGSIKSWQWTQASGPSQANIASVNTDKTEVSSLAQGTYTFTLKVTDDKGATANSSVSVTVNAAPNQGPSVSAGNDQSITLPNNSATLTGTASDPDGNIASYKWTQVAGPAQASFSAASAASTKAGQLVQGNYTFRLTVMDNDGASAWSEMHVTVKPAANKPPTVTAGTNQSITLPTNSTTLSGTASDPDGSIATYQWTQTAGPAQASFGSASSASTSVSNLLQGTYTFRLTAKDNAGASVWSEVNVMVNPRPNVLPSVDAGADQNVTLPTDSVRLSGIATDADGSIAFHRWTQTSGPTKASFSAASPLEMVASGLVQGVYTFRLTVSDNDGGTAWDEVKVTVMPDLRRQSSASVYPNPAKEQLFLKIDAITLQSNSSLRITNAAGKLMYSENFIRNGFRMLKEVDISRLPAGAYFLTVNTDMNTIKTLRFIKQ